MEQKLKYLNLPQLLRFNDGSEVNGESWPRRRIEILENLQENWVGKLPREPVAVREKARVGYDSDWGMDGKAHSRVEMITIELEYENGTFEFPFRLQMPVGVKKPPLLVTVGMSLEGIFAALPPHEFAEKGIAVAALSTNDITADAWGFDDGICKLLWPEGHSDSDAGKLLIWGRCMGYVKDLLLARGCFDETRIGCAGCSRFGKTAMVAGAFDEGFTHVVSVCSGTGGASLLRGKIGETVANISENYGYWFCEGFKKYAGREDEMPLDAHFLAQRFILRQNLAGDGFNAVGTQLLLELPVAKHKPANGKTCARQINLHQPDGEHTVAGIIPQIIQSFLQCSANAHILYAVIQSIYRIAKAHLNLSRNGADGRIPRERRADFMNRRVGQRQRAQQADGYQQPCKINGPAAERLSAKHSDENHQQNGNGSHQIGFNQKIVNQSGPHWCFPPLARRPFSLSSRLLSSAHGAMETCSFGSLHT